MRLLLLLILLSNTVSAEGDKGAQPLPTKDLQQAPSKNGTEKVLPVLSPAGKKRAQENIAILEQNLKDLDKNIAASEHNISVIQSEIKDLEGLQQDHLELKKKYIEYLAAADREMEKNYKSLKKIQEYERSVASNKDPFREGQENQKVQSDSVQLERMERERWSADSQAKVTRVHELMQELLKNVQDIESRKGPLQTQLKQWNERQKEYRRLVTELTTRKSDLEQLVKN